MRNKAFETIVNTNPEVVVVFDHKLRVQFLNKAAFVFLGLTPEQTIGKPLTEVCPLEIREAVQSLCENALAWAHLEEGEVSGVLLNGEPYTSALQAVPIVSAGKTIQILLLSHDITDRKKVERQHEDHLRRLDTLLNVLLDLLSVNDTMRLLDGVAIAAKGLTNARLAIASHLGQDGEWAFGPCHRSEGVAACLPATELKGMGGGIYRQLLTQYSTMRLTDEQMRKHAMWRGLPPGHVPLRGFLAARIVNGRGKTVGIISLSDKETGNFTAVDEALLKHLGALASLALQHIEARNQAEERAKQAEEANLKLEKITSTLAKTAAELSQSNKDLEQFAYIASHDLQEPLRMITGFLELLQQQYRDKLEPSAQEFIAYAVDDAARMHTLISDLLAYSRVGSQRMPLEETDLNSIVDRVLAMLGGPLEDCGAHVLCDSLPSVMADDTQLIQLYQNLVANSIKFRGNEKLQIHIGVRQENGGWLFWVRDNGVGFPQAHAARAFKIFQRLHPRAKYQGNGLGLAICKRVVERHGGKIWAESQPGKGATFYFTLKT